MSEVLSSLFHRWEECGTQRWNIPPRVTWLTSGRDRTWTLVIWLRKPYLNKLHCLSECTWRMTGEWMNEWKRESRDKVETCHYFRGRRLPLHLSWLVGTNRVLYNNNISLFRCKLKKTGEMHHSPILCHLEMVLNSSKSYILRSLTAMF